MLKASKAIYLVSAVLSAIGLVSCVVMAIMSDTITKLIEESAATYWQTLPAVAVEWIGFGLSVGMIIGAIVCAVQVGLAIYGYVSIGRNGSNIAPHVVAIVFGVFGNILLLIAGILAVVELSGTNKTGGNDQSGGEFV